tara:strand:+ start:448 stop:1305 length:858 start_codon:yes stop_codon:yes gene_type:complete
MRKIYLEGMLGEKFGSEWNLDVTSPAEALQAISAQRPGMRQFLIEGENIQGYDILIDDEYIESYDELTINNISEYQTYSFVPIVAGSKSSGILMVLGVALMAMTGGLAAFGITGLGSVSAGASVTVTAGNASIFGAQAVVGSTVTATATQAAALNALAIQGTTAGYMMAGAQFLGQGLLLMGVSMMLTETPEGDNASQAENYLFSGPVNTVKQGEPIPLVYGRMVTGSKTVMGSIFTTSSDSESQVTKNRKLVGVDGFRDDGTQHGNSSPAGRYRYKPPGGGRRP